MFSIVKRVARLVRTICPKLIKISSLLEASPLSVSKLLNLSENEQKNLSIDGK